MLLLPYAEAEHYAMLAAWWAGHGTQALPPRWLSPLGMIAWDGPPADGAVLSGGSGEPAPLGLAACWLYVTGTAVCWIENLVSNPAAPKRAQCRGIDAVIAELLRIAKATGHEVASAFTESAHVLRRTVRKHGFQPMPAQQLIMRKL